MELTDKQIRKQDYVDSTIYNLLNELSPSQSDIEWDIDCIGRVRDVICKIFVEKKLCSEMDFYPFIEE